MENYLRVGVITSPHGVHGEVKVFPTTDDPSRFLELETVLLDLSGGNERKELTIRQVRFFKNLVILGFEGITSRDQVEGWRQKELWITRDQAVELSEHFFYTGVQYHPEFKSRPQRPHPLFAAFIGAALQREQETEG